MKKIMAIVVLSLMALATQAQQEYDTVIYYPPQIRNQPTAWSPDIRNSIRYEYYTFDLFYPYDDPNWHDGCPMDNVDARFVVELRLCDSTLFPLFYYDSTYIPYMKQINGFAQPYHFDSVVTILGVAARMTYYGVATTQYDTLNGGSYLTATKLFKIQATSMSIAYDSIVTTQNGHYDESQPNIHSGPMNYDSTFTQVYFRRLNPLRLQDFCISFTIDSCNNNDLC